MSRKVQVYIYDLSMGLAAQFSPLFLGKQINGIWHTGIVVYGKEWFFGGEGIMHVPPGGTVIGPPHKVEDLGETEVPEEVFHDYLKDISDQFSDLQKVFNFFFFSNQKYDLFTNNCNSFSNEIAQFLTSKTIPDYITNLPQEVLETPFGAQIKPFLDRMQDIRGSSDQSIPAPALTPPPTNPALATTGGGGSASTKSFPESEILKITSNGFSRSDAIKELERCNGNADTALAYLIARSLSTK